MPMNRNENESNHIVPADRPSRRRHHPTVGGLEDDDSLPRQSLVIRSVEDSSPPGRSRRRRRRREPKNVHLIAALLVLVVFWIVCFILVMERKNDMMPTSSAAAKFSLAGVHDTVQKYRSTIRKHQQNTQQQHLQGDHGVPDGHQKTKSVEPHLVSRKPNKVIATSDVRGNLGPASVVIQAKPGTDWIHDRWQAASDMHGTQIRGAHWIQLEFQDATIVANKIILDWETAYADEYVIEGSLEPFVAEKEGTQNQVWTLFDGRTPTNVAEMRSVSESGQSPGVQEKRPLHIVHEIRLTQSTDAEINRVRLKPIRYLRLRILKSVTGWGVSLWQFDVYGFRASELQTS